MGGGRRRTAWLVCVVLGGLGAAVVWWALPRSYEASLGEYAVKLAVFVLLSATLALLPVPGARCWWLVVVALGVFAGYLVPRISGYYFLDTGRTQPEAFYTHLYLLTLPAIVLTAAGAFRLGGGTSGRTLKIAWSGAVVIFSGFLDVMWQLVNPVTEIPDRLAPPHVTVITGGPVTYPELVWFTLAHVPVLVAVLVLPLDRWLDRWLGPDPALGTVGGAATGTGRHRDDGGRP